MRKVRWKEVACLWRVLGHDETVKAVVAEVLGYKKRFTVVTSAVGQSGLQAVELFRVRSSQEDGYRDLKQRPGWEECHAWTRAPIERTTQVQWMTMSLPPLLPSRLDAEGSTDWGSAPPWNKKKDRPSVRDAERLARRHRSENQHHRAAWLRDEEEAARGGRIFSFNMLIQQLHVVRVRVRGASGAALRSRRDGYATLGRGEKPGFRGNY